MAVASGHPDPSPPNAFLPCRRRCREAKIVVAPCRDLLKVRFVFIRQRRVVGSAAGHHGEEHDPQRERQDGIIGHRRDGHFKKAEIVHKDLIALIPPVPPRNRAGQRPPPAPPAKCTDHHAGAERLAVFPDAVAHEP